MGLRVSVTAYSLTAPGFLILFLPCIQVGNLHTGFWWPAQGCSRAAVTVLETK